MVLNNWWVDVFFDFLWFEIWLSELFWIIEIWYLKFLSFEDWGLRIEWSDLSFEYLIVVLCLKFLIILLKGYFNEGLGNINGEMCE